MAAIARNHKTCPHDFAITNRDLQKKLNTSKLVFLTVFLNEINLSRNFPFECITSLQCCELTRRYSHLLFTQISPLTMLYTFDQYIVNVQWSITGNGFLTIFKFGIRMLILFKINFKMAIWYLCRICYEHFFTPWYLVWLISLIDCYFVCLCKNASVVNTRRDIANKINSYTYEEIDKENRGSPYFNWHCQSFKSCEIIAIANNCTKFRSEIFLISPRLFHLRKRNRNTKNVLTKLLEETS